MARATGRCRSWQAEYRLAFEPLLQDVYFVPFGDAQAVENELRKAEAVGMAIAGVVVEPIQGEAGAIVPPPDFWPACVISARASASPHRGRGPDRHGPDGQDVRGGALGRGAGHHVPGKALGGGVMPLSAFMSTPEIWKVLEPNPFIHSSTFGGNPLACAAGIAAVNVTLEEDLPGQAAATGDYLMAELRKLQRHYSEHLMEVGDSACSSASSFVDTSSAMPWRRVSSSGACSCGTLLNAKTCASSRP